MSQPAVSQHLKVLKRAGSVSDRPVGARRVHQLAPEGLAELQAYLEAFWKSRPRRPQAGRRARRARRNDMSDTQATALSVEQTIRIEAPRERVFALLTDGAEIPRWMPMTLEPRVGGRVERW